MADLRAALPAHLGLSCCDNITDAAVPAPGSCGGIGEAVTVSDERMVIASNRGRQMRQLTGGTSDIK